MTDLEKLYTERYSLALEPMAPYLRSMILDFFDGLAHVDRIDVRPKSIESFLKKAATRENSINKYSDPFHQIQDQLGARIVCFYLDDIAPIAVRVNKYFRLIEVKDIVPDRETEFGYFGKHFILLAPRDFDDRLPNPKLLPNFFEFQIKTLYQHAWAQANHEIAYKPVTDLSTDDKRRVAFTAAQSWGADMIFNELQQSLCNPRT